MVVNEKALLPQSGCSRPLACELLFRARTRSVPDATDSGKARIGQGTEGVTSRMWHQPDGGWRQKPEKNRPHATR